MAIRKPRDYKNKSKIRLLIEIHDLKIKLDEIAGSYLKLKEENEGLKAQLRGFNQGQDDREGLSDVRGETDK